MSRDPVERVIEWLHGQLKGSAVPAELELGHMNGDQSVTPCARFPVPPLTEGELGDLAARAYQCAAEHAEVFPTPQTYQLAIVELGDDGKRTPRATLLVRCQGAQPTRLELTPTEPASLVGVLSQLMRHLEASARTNQALLTTSLTTLGRELERKDKRIAELEHARSSSLDALESLALATHERELGKLKAERGEARKDEALRSLKLLMPPIVAAAAGKLGLPANIAQNTADTANLEAMRQWLKSLTREQFAAILANATAAQQAAILNAYKSLALADEPGFADLAGKGLEDA